MQKKTFVILTVFVYLAGLTMPLRAHFILSPPCLRDVPGRPALYNSDKKTQPDFEEQKNRIRGITENYLTQHNKIISLSETVKLYNQQFADNKFSGDESLRQWMNYNGIKGPEIGLLPAKGVSLFSAFDALQPSDIRKQKGNNEQYLMPTALCDCTNEKIINKINKWRSSYRSSKMKNGDIDYIWYVLKSRMFFGVGFGAYWDMPASETVTEITKNASRYNYGMNFNLINAFVAMVRALGVPARYKIVLVPKSQFAHLYSQEQYEKMDSFVPYMSAEVFVAGHWKEYGLFRANQFTMPGQEYYFSSIDAYALHLAGNNSRAQCDKNEVLRQGFMKAKKGKDRATMFLVEQCNVILRAVYNIALKKKQPTLAAVSVETSFFAKNNDRVKELTASQITNALYSFGLADILSKQRTNIEPNIKILKKIAQDLAKKNKSHFPKPSEVITVYNIQHPDERIAFPTFSKWLRDNPDENMGIADLISMPKPAKKKAGKAENNEFEACALDIEKASGKKEKLPFEGALLPGEILVLKESYLKTYPQLNSIDMLEKIEQDKNWAFLAVCIKNVQSENASAAEKEGNQKKIFRASSALYAAFTNESMAGAPKVMSAIMPAESMLRTFSLGQAEQIITYELGTPDKINDASWEDLNFAYDYINKFIDKISSKNPSLGKQGFELFKTIGEILKNPAMAHSNDSSLDTLIRSINISP